MTPPLLEALSPRANAETSICPDNYSLHEYHVEPIFGNKTFNFLNAHLSGACALFATIVMWFLRFQHATHLSRPREQVKIMRIAHLIPTYSLISWFCVLIPRAYYYFSPWLDLVQSICMVSFFLLLCELVAPNEDQRRSFFAIIDITDQRDKLAKTGRIYDTPERKLVWYRRKWIAIYQYPIVSFLVGAITDATEATGIYCGNSMAPRYAHLWMFLLQQVSVTIAVSAILMMYSNLKRHLAHHRPMSKLLAIKLVVFLGFAQGIIFQILQATHVIKPNSVLTYADIKVGIPTLVTCLEMVPLSLYSLYAYSYRPYIIGRLPPQPTQESQVPPQPPAASYKGGFLGWRAILMILDPRDFFGGMIFAFRMASELREQGTDRMSFKGGYDTQLNSETGPVDKRH